MLDVKRLVSEVAARNGIRIDEDDPAFCLVTLNQLVLEETVTKAAEEIRAASRDFEEAVHKVQARTGVLLGQQVKRCLEEARHLLTRDVVAVKRQMSGPSDQIRWIVIGLLSALLIFTGGWI